jgi:hypothetical protein
MVCCRIWSGAQRTRTVSRIKDSNTNHDWKKQKLGQYQPMRALPKTVLKWTLLPECNSKAHSRRQKDDEHLRHDEQKFKAPNRIRPEVPRKMAQTHEVHCRLVVFVIYLCHRICSRIANLGLPNPIRWSGDDKSQVPNKCQHSIPGALSASNQETEIPRRAR